MAEKFNWFRLGYELVKAKYDWNVQVPLLQNRDGEDEYLISPFFPTPDTPNSQLIMGVKKKCRTNNTLCVALRFHGKRKRFRRTSSSENVDP